MPDPTTVDPPEARPVPAGRTVLRLSRRIARHSSKPFFGLSAALFLALLATSLAFPELGGPGIGNLLLMSGAACSLLLYRSERAQNALGLAGYWLLIAGLAAAGMAGLGTGISSAFAAVCLVSTTIAALFLNGRQAIALWAVLFITLGGCLWAQQAGHRAIVPLSPVAEGLILGAGALLAAGMAWLLARHTAGTETELDALRLREKATIDEAQEQERRRIAQDLHDDLQQTLGAIGMELDAMRQRPGVDPAELRAMLERTGTMTSTAIDAIRRIINGLRPHMLDDLGLVAALEALVADFGQRCGIQSEFELLGPAAATDLEHGILQRLAGRPQLATCLYRVAQEALNNVHRHAGASFVHVQLELTADDGLALIVTDNGIGIRADDIDRPDSLGVLGMHERVASLGGQLRVSRQAAGGTTVEARVALAAEPA